MDGNDWWANYDHCRPLHELPTNDDDDGIGVITNTYRNTVKIWPSFNMPRGQNTNTYGAEIRTDTVFYPSVHESLQIQGVQSCTAKSLVAGTPFVWKNVFWSFLTKSKQDQTLPCHAHEKILPHSTQFLSICQFFGTPCTNT